MDIVILLSILSLIVYFWYTSLTTREIAEKSAQHLCQQLDLQLLDHSVSNVSLTLVRQTNGHLGLRRIYHFEFSEDGKHRTSGRVVMIGKRIQNVQVDTHDGTTIDQK